MQQCKMYRRRLIRNSKFYLLEKDSPRIYERNKGSELIKQKQLYEKCLDEINNLKMEILETMIKNEHTEEKLGQLTEKHTAAVAVYDAAIEQIESKIVTLKREKQIYDAEKEERRIQRRLEEERRILEIQMEVKNKEESLLNY